ncbi:MAG: hypothetical protein QM734_15535 [Cyclobacteriaceae bacterium]
MDILSLKCSKVQRLHEKSLFYSDVRVGSNNIFWRCRPHGEDVRMDNKADIKVTGVYDDIPYNSDFRDMLTS